MQPIAGYILVFIGTGLMMRCNAIWFQAKFALRRRGYPADLFFNHWRDFKMIDVAVIEEADPAELNRLLLIRRRMKLIWIMFPTAVVAFILGAILMGK